MYSRKKQLNQDTSVCFQCFDAPEVIYEKMLK